MALASRRGAGLLLLALAAGPSPAAEAGGGLSRGQVVYLPAYPQVYHGSRQDYALTTTILIRNTDPAESLTLAAVDYHDATGRKLRSLLPGRPALLAPLASLRLVVDKESPREELAAGTSVLVRWEAKRPINPPLLDRSPSAPPAAGHRLHLPGEGARRAPLKAAGRGQAHSPGRRRAQGVVPWFRPAAGWESTLPPPQDRPPRVSSTSWPLPKSPAKGGLRP